MKTSTLFLTMGVLAFLILLLNLMSSVLFIREGRYALGIVKLGVTLAYGGLVYAVFRQHPEDDDEDEDDDEN